MVISWGSYDVSGRMELVQLVPGLGSTYPLVMSNIAIENDHL